MNKDQIPKRIFYVWGAGERKRRDVNTCILSWKLAMPDYEIIEINEKSTEYFDFQKELQENRWFREIYSRKMYAYVADYIRVNVLYKHGGIYLDTDVFALKSLDKFLSEPAFVGIQGNTKEIGQEWVEPAILGAKKENKFLELVANFYQNEIWNSPLYMIPDIFQHFLSCNYSVNKFPDKQNQGIIHLNDITLYPEEYFIPCRLNQEFTFDKIGEKTHTVHLFEGSWNKPEIRYFLKNKHKYPLYFINIMGFLKHLFRLRLGVLQKK